MTTPPLANPSPLDLPLLFSTRILRMVAYGLLSVVLVLYLSSLGFSDRKIGLLLTLTLIGDTAISLWLTTVADRLGRKRMLIAGALLMLAAGIVFALTQSWPLLLVAATIGVISPSGNEVGPFLSIEQAALSHVIDPQRRTHIFAWYNLVGSFATAAGALAAGLVTQLLQQRAGLNATDSYRAIVAAYALIGAILAVMFLRLSPAVEATPAEKSAEQKRFLGLHESRRTVFKLASLFALDAFGGGFVIQSLVAYWFYLRFGVQPATLGAIFFGANIFAGISALLAARVARKIGLINTMVLTHLPSNILLILVPLMPNLWSAIAVLLARFSISQMDVPTRQSYTMAVVKPDERSAAAGITGVARTLGAALAPMIAGALFATPGLLSVPFYLAGGLKIAYDLLLYRAFVKTQVEGEPAPKSS